MTVKLDINFETKEFNKAFNQYIALNKRAVAGLVEHTARKVVTGFNPRSPSNAKVKGLRQTFYEKRATPSKIIAEYKNRVANKQGTLRPPFHYVSAKARATVKYRRTKAAINWRKGRGTAWLQATMLYKNWRPTLQQKSKTFKPSLDAKHKGPLPDTEVRVRTMGNKPYVLWISAVPGVVKGKYINRAIARALRDSRRDMQVYIKRKLNNIPFSARKQRI